MATKTIELPVIKDAYVCDCKPDETNPNGNEDVLFQGEFKKCIDRTLMQWDFSELENAKIIKAELHLFATKTYAYGNRDGKMVYLPLSGNWDDKIITCKTLPEVNQEFKVITDWPKDNSWHVVDITKIFKQWIDGGIQNYGLYCYAEQTSSTHVVKFVSTEGKPVKSRPKLVIEYF